MDEVKREDLLVVTAGLNRRSSAFQAWRMLWSGWLLQREVSADGK
jgi:hypothetical protein